MIDYYLYDDLLETLIEEEQKKNGCYPVSITINRAEARSIIADVRDPNWLATHAKDVQDWLDSKRTPFLTRVFYIFNWSPDITILVKQ